MIKQFAVPLCLQLFIVKLLHCLIVHYWFVKVKFWTFLRIFALSNLYTPLVGESFWKVGVKAKSHDHICKIFGTAVEVQHKAEQEEFNCDGSEKPKHKSTSILDWSQSSIDGEYSIFATRFVKVQIESMQMVEGIRGYFPDTLLNHRGNRVHTILLEKGWKKSGSTK